MRVLVGCECSQVVTAAFIVAGHDAFSCDIKSSYGAYPERHFQGDIREVYERVKPIVSWTHIHYSPRIRSQTFQGIAHAMAAQWSGKNAPGYQFCLEC